MGRHDTGVRFRGAQHGYADVATSREKENEDGKGIGLKRRELVVQRGVRGDALLNQ